MKKKTLVLLPLLFSMLACSGSVARAKGPARPEIDFDTLEDNNFQPTTVTGELSSFNLVSPFNGAVVTNNNEYRWEASTNAETYTIQICSDDRFITDNPMIDYYSSSNITANYFKVNSDFLLKDTTYYWRVFAFNSENTLMCSEVFHFFVEAPSVEEVPFDFGEADDWTLHPVGSYADISIDRNDFFGKGNDSLVVSFKKEDTQRGITSSDGWVVVQKTIEKSIYGTDGIFFDMCYAGNDADIIIRLVDRDNEYWYCPVAISLNAKQSVLLRFEDFIQRFGDVTVANMTFDFERIKYLEVVFEKVTGDGILFISGMKAIKFANYKHLFMDKLDFTSYPESSWSFDTYNYPRDVSQYEMTLNYTANCNSAGYGFTRIYLYQYLFGGDAIKLSIKYTGAKGNQAFIRLREEDEDQFLYRMPYSTLSSEYQTYVIPFSAFENQSMSGDGKRQFAVMKFIEFGLNGMYGTGTTSFKDIEVVKKVDYTTNDGVKVVDASGLVEDFNNYSYPAQVAHYWKASIDNKEEYMSYSTSVKTGAGNVAAGHFEYKADMVAAKYSLPVKVSNNFTSLSIYMKDSTVKNSGSKYSNLTNVHADTWFFLATDDEVIYEYHLGTLNPYWTEYVIPLTSFTPQTGSVPLNVTKINEISFSLSYYYYNNSGKPDPTYQNDNIVYVDNIFFGHDTEYSATQKERYIEMVDGISMFDDFESYASTDDVRSVWTNGYDYDYHNVQLSNEVSSEGGNHSLYLGYQTNSESVSYEFYPTLANTIQGRGFHISIKSALKATVYVNVFIGDSKFRATLSNINNTSGWVDYTVGLLNIINTNSAASKKTFSMAEVASITKITIGITCSQAGEAAAANILIDNFRFDLDVDYEADGTGATGRRVIGQEDGL